MNVLITGATSFLGAETARAFLKAGHHVYAPVRPSSRRTAFLPEHRNLVRLEADMDDIALLCGMGLPEMQAAVHFAWGGVGVKGRMDPEIQEKNVRNTLKFLRVSRQLGCRAFLFAGSQAEYGVTLERVEARKMSPAAEAAPEVTGVTYMVSEETPCHPISEYGKGKLRILKEGAELAKQMGIVYRHMRIFSVYGTGDHETSLISSCVRAAKEGRTAELGPCRQQWNFLHVKDCAAAILALAEHALGEQALAEHALSEQALAEHALTEHAPAEPAPAAESRSADCASDAGDVPGFSEASRSCVFNIGSSDTRPLREFVQEVFDIAPSCGYDGAGFRLEERAAGPEGTPYLSPDISKIRRETGWSPRISFREGIREMLLK